MKLSTLRPFLLSACFLLAVALVATLLSSCDGNHIIGDEYGELECRTISVDQCFAVQCGYGLLPELTADSEIVANELFCPKDFCDVDVVETDTDTCDLSVPVGHRPIECRGKGHSSLECDKNCGEYDPICIPCDLQVLAQHCETVCTPLPGGGVSCIQTCYDRTGRRV